jgi:diadenosine tetraphosphate (Ap4A) HIT family hydrolase
MSVFNTIAKEDKVYSGDNFFMIFDRYPVSLGHILIISNDSSKINFFDLSNEEKLELMNLLEIGKVIINEKFKPDGFNIGMNCGESAGQTVMHFHCHLIPRYIGDMDDPRGGIRYCIPEKGNYKL